MSEMDISSVAQSDLTNTVTDYSVADAMTDGATGDKETFYINQKWSKQLGYYKSVPDLKATIDAKARWVIGKGLKAAEEDLLLIRSIIGFGKDTFNTILENQIRTYHIAGDSFAEIIRDGIGIPVNLKPLDPGVIKIVCNSKGLITRYEQVSKNDNNKVLRKFKPKDILHFSRNRTADEIHGISIIDAVEDIILMRNEAMKDMRTLMHRHVKPIVKWQIDTDDVNEIAAFKAKADAAVENGENLYIPMGAADAEYLSLASNATLNPIPWISTLNSYFFQMTGVPQIIVGGSAEITEASAKIAYLAWEQTVEEEQLYIEEEIGMQMGLDIELEFPATLQNEMLSDQSKSERMQAATPEDTAVTGAIQ